ncbi:hypothetical protein CC79DRAFT_828767 [Sarocladium strictum]
MLNRFGRHVKIVATAQRCPRKHARWQAALMSLSSDIDAMIDMCKQPLCTVPTAPTILNRTQPHAPHPRLSFHSFGSVIARLLHSIDPALALLFDNSTCFASPNNIHSHTHSPTLPRDFHDRQPTVTCGVPVTHTLAPPATTTRAKKRHRHCFSRSGACRCARVPTSLPYPLLQLRGTTSISDGKSRNVQDESKTPALTLAALFFLLQNPWWRISPGD